MHLGLSDIFLWTAANRGLDWTHRGPASIKRSRQEGMATSQSTRQSKGQHDEDDRKPLRGALRRLGLWSSEGDAGAEQPQTAIPPARTVRYEGDGEHHNLQFMQRYLRVGDAVLDVGANIGLSGVTLARLTRRVMAFEPSPPNAAFLRRNTSVGDQTSNRSHSRLISAPGWWSA